MSNVQVIVGSTRSNRVGPTIAQWFVNQVSERPDATYELVDLADWRLPLLDEPYPTRMGKYQHAHTKAWSKKIAAADGYVIVTSEYNHGYPVSLKNALDYLYSEWNDKPVAFVSYGWGGGTLSVEQLKQVVANLRMKVVEPQLHIYFKPNMFNGDNKLIDPELTLADYEVKARAVAGALEEALRPAAIETAQTH